MTTATTSRRSTSTTTRSASPRPRKRPARRFPPEVLSPAEVRALLDSCAAPDSSAHAPGRAPACARNRALLVVLYRAGLRVGEALALCPKDLDLQAGTLRVLRGKGGHARTAGLDPAAARELAAWLEVRQSMLGAPAPGAPVFCTSKGTAVTAGYLRRLLPALAKAAGLAKRVHAHGLRHTHASELRREGVDVGVISRQLGHRSILTTIRYLDHIAPTAVVEAMRKREW